MNLTHPAPRTRVLDTFVPLRTSQAHSILIIRSILKLRSDTVSDREDMVDIVDGHLARPASE